MSDAQGIEIEEIKLLKNKLIELAEKLQTSIYNFFTETVEFNPHNEGKVGYHWNKMPLYLKKARLYKNIYIDAAFGLEKLEKNEEYENLSNEEQLEKVINCLKYINNTLLSDYFLSGYTADIKKFTVIVETQQKLHSQRLESLKNNVLFLQKTLADNYRKNLYYSVLMDALNIDRCIEISKVLGLTEKQARYVGAIFQDLSFKELCEFVGSSRNSIGHINKEVCRKLSLQPVGGEADNYNIKRYITSLDPQNTFNAAKVIFEGSIQEKTALAKNYQENWDIAEFVKSDPELMQLVAEKMEQRKQNPNIGLLENLIEAQQEGRA